MATIADTLNDIQKLQNDISRKLENSAELESSKFVRDLMNFTTVQFFTLLSHAALDVTRAAVNRGSCHPYAERYYSMFRQPGVLEEFIRSQNVAGMFLLWNIFEQYVDRRRSRLPGQLERTLEARYKSVLRHSGIRRSDYDDMVNEFNLIRLTRNSLHSGGIYRNSRKFTYTLKQQKYVLEAGKAVSPIRVMHVTETMWKHFVAVGCRS